jgi:hypothetical protein
MYFKTPFQSSRSAIRIVFVGILFASLTTKAGANCVATSISHERLAASPLVILAQSAVKKNRPAAVDPSEPGLAKSVIINTAPAEPTNTSASPRPAPAAGDPTKTIIINTAPNKGDESPSPKPPPAPVEATQVVRSTPVPQTDQAVQLLAALLQCQAPPNAFYEEEDIDGFAHKETWLSSMAYAGDSQKLFIVGKTEQHFFNGQIPMVIVLHGDSTYSATYSKTSSVPVVGRTMTINCIANPGSNRSCIQHITHERKCSSWDVNQNDCNGPILTHSEALVSARINWCDSETAAAAKIAIEILIRSAAQNGAGSRQ